MREQGKLAQFFFGKRIPVDLAKLNEKELRLYQWNQICRNITNFFYFAVYNVCMGFGWAYIIHSHAHWNMTELGNSLGGYTAYLGYGVGHIALNITHYIVHRFSKNKTRKDVLNDGNPIPKISMVSKFFLIVSVVCFLIWLVGLAFIFWHLHTYKKVHGSYLRATQKRAQDLENKKIDKDIALQTASSIFNELASKNKE